MNKIFIIYAYQLFKTKTTQVYEHFQNGNYVAFSKTRQNFSSDLSSYFFFFAVTYIHFKPFRNIVSLEDSINPKIGALAILGFLTIYKY